ncbi:hypothetical protein ACFSCV_12180 [Methylopila henanensis]|uniref:Uncharacterized protein n=1 Tax=Methylopila henanensis TaxID=873516 RepID=A0ABW4K7V0_9HYPH
MTETLDDPPGSRPHGGLSRLGRFLTSPLRRLLANADDPATVRARTMSDAELAEALGREVYAAQNADDEIWVEGMALVEEAARRLAGRERP